MQVKFYNHLPVPNSLQPRHPLTTNITNPGIGFEIVKSLSSLRADYQILLGSRDIQKGEAAAASIGAPTNVNPIQLDITDDRSVDHCYRAIEQHFGRLDILINNAGTAGNDLLSPATTPRQRWAHVFDINVVSTGVLTETLIPLLEHSRAPKIIFITSDLGSIGTVVKNGRSAAPRLPFYSASKAAVNMLTVQYATAYPRFKVSACCPGLRATAIHASEITAEDADPARGAVNAVRLATEVNGPSGTYTNSEGTIPW